MKYIIKEITTNNQGIIDIPDGAIPTGEVRHHEINSLTENICHRKFYKMLDTNKGRF